MTNIKISIYIDEETRKKIDELYIKSIQSGERLNKSQIVSNAIEYYYEKKK